MNTDYEKQAEDFLKKTSTTISWKFLKYDKYFTDDKEKRLVWEFTLTRGTRAYTSTFGESTLSTFEQLTGEKFPVGRLATSLHYERIMKENARSLSSDGRFSRVSPHHPKNCQLQPPSNYSLLACLERYEPDPNIDNWSKDLGYDPSAGISRIIKTHNACREQYAALCALYSEAEMNLLCEIS